MTETILYTYPTVDPSIALHDVRVAPCARVLTRGDRLVACGHTVATRRTHKGEASYRCVGCNTRS